MKRNKIKAIPKEESDIKKKVPTQLPRFGNTFLKNDPNPDHRFNSINNSMMHLKES